VNDLLQFYGYATYMYWPAALVGKIALLSALIAVVTGNQNPGQKLLTGVLAAHLIISAFILYSGLITLGLPFGPRAIRTPVGEPVDFLALIIGALVLIPAFSAQTAWQTRSEHTWANWTFWAAMAVAMLHPFFNDSLAAGFFKSPMAVLPHPTLLAGCALVWMTGSSAPRLAAIPLLAGAALLGIYDALLWGIASSWLLILFAAAAAVPLLAPDFTITLHSSTSSGSTDRSAPAVRGPRAPKKSKQPDAPKWKLK